jgi:UDPglucose 6-dehydrogenase
MEVCSCFYFNNFFHYTENKEVNNRKRGSLVKKHLSFVLLTIVHLALPTQKITIIGTGYVGLVSGAGLAELGNTVICADIDKEKIAGLNQGIIPIYEPDLDELVIRNTTLNRLTFTAEIGQAVESSDVIFIAVGTPMSDDGTADLRYVQAVLETIAKHLNSPKVICIKSTVPAGTGAWAAHLLQLEGANPNSFDMASNPEFLREGSSVQDFLFPDRLVIGASNPKVHDIMCDIYRPLIEQGIPHINTNIESSELIKYASNAFLAVKLSFINEIANLCDITGAHAQTVALAMGMDTRIGNKFLNPGPGFGGSCFPKDCQELICFAQKRGVYIPTVQAALTTNQLQKFKPVEKLKQLLSMQSLEGKRIAVLGLAFKGNTDDIRYSPAKDVITMLIAERAFISAYDPQATANMQREIPHITYCSSELQAVENADALIIMTEWPQFKNLDLAAVKSLMRSPVIIDARNLLSTQTMRELGFSYATIGNGRHVAFGS